MSPPLSATPNRCAIAAVALIGAARLLSATALAAADDLTILRAAVEERLTSIRTLEVRYRKLQQPKGGSPSDAPTQELPAVWCWADGRESYSRNAAPGILPAGQWAYDGRRTIEFVYGLAQPERPSRIEVRPGPPRAEMLHYAEYAYCLGQRLPWADVSLLDVLRSASARLTWETDHKGTRVPVVELRTRGRGGVPLLVRVAFDSTTSGMPRRIEQRHALEEGDPADPEAFWAISTVESVREIRDAQSGEPVSFPWSVRLEGGKSDELQGRARIEVDDVRLNHPIPDSRFTLALPFGAEVHEYSRRPGDVTPRRYLVGGESAVDAALAKREEQVRRELESLAAEGVQFDARPPGRYGWTAWLVGLGVVSLAVATVVVIVRRLRQA